MNRFTKTAGALLALTAMLTCAGGAAEMLDLSALGDVQEAEMLDLSALGDVQEAQPLDGDAQAWTYPIPYELLMNSDYIQLVNRDNLLSESDVPEDLVKDLDCRKISYDPIRLREVAAGALKALFDAAQEDGIYLYAHSGYRSYQTQNTMYYNRLKSHNGVDDGVVQYPGASEHQTGLAIDVINKAGIGKKFTSAFAKTKEGMWLAENCWDYGFIIRYQEDKEDITQITAEAWHLRYVGVQVAQYMRDRNLCLEEFTAEWKEAVAAFGGAQ